MIKINKIWIEGFGSIVIKLKYKFGRPGLCAIHGSNGAGKTTIFNALCWALYGELLKKGMGIEPWDNLKSENYRGTMVKVEIDNHIIIRCKDFKGKIDGKKGGNGIFIYKDQELLPLKGKSEAQKYIIEYLGYSFTLFKNSILFGQEMKRLMEEDGPTRKKVLEEAFEVTFISKAKELGEKRLNEVTGKIVEFTHKLSSLNTRINDAKYALTQALEDRKNHETDTLGRIKYLKLQINKLLGQMPSFNRKPDNWDEHIEKKKKEIAKLKKKADPDIRDKEFKAFLELSKHADICDGWQKAVESAKIAMKTKICPECGGKMDLTKIKERYNLNKKNLEQSLETYNKLKAEHDILKERKSSQESLTMGISKQELELRELEQGKVAAEKNKSEERLTMQVVEEKRKTLKHLESFKGKFRIKEKKAKLRTLRDEWKSISEEYKPYVLKQKNLKWVINDPLSNSGLKSYIFDTMLGKVNQFLKQYTKDIGFLVKVFIDMESANKNVEILIQKKEMPDYQINYYDLSKGQKQLVNVALIFALNDVITQAKPLNLLIVDEVFESLSDDNVEIVANVIQRKSAYKSIHLITHHSKFNPTGCYRTYLTLDEKLGTQLHTKYADN